MTFVTLSYNSAVKCTPILLLLVLTACSRTPESATPQTLDALELPHAQDLIFQAIDREIIPGAVLVAGDAQGVQFRRSFGMRTITPTPEPLHPEAIFDLASLTKPLATAAAIHKLAESGRLRLDETVVEHLPEFAPHGKQAITIEQLLLHTGGLIADNALKDYQDTPERAWQRICDLKPVAPAGERFVYSDVGYIVLARLVEAVSGQPLDQFCLKTFYEPLRMTHTRFNPPSEWQQQLVPTEPGVPIGRVHDPRAAALGGVAGHAGLFGNADDLGRFCRMLLNGGALDGVRVLSAASVKRFTTPQPVPGGRRTLGFDADTAYSSARGGRFDPATTCGHTGFTGPMVWIDPIRKVFMVLLTSRLHPDGHGNVLSLRRAVATSVAEAMLGDAPGVLNGIDQLERDNFAKLADQRVGLITNHTGPHARRSAHGRRAAPRTQRATRSTLQSGTRSGRRGRRRRKSRPRQRFKNRLTGLQSVWRNATPHC